MSSAPNVKLVRQIEVSIQFSHTITDKFNSGCHFPTDSQNLSPHEHLLSFPVTPVCSLSFPVKHTLSAPECTPCIPLHSLSVTIYFHCALLLAPSNSCAPCHPLLSTYFEDIQCTIILMSNILSAILKLN